MTLATRVLRVLMPFALGYYLSYVYRTVNAVLAPDLTVQLGLSAADLGVLTAAYFLTFAAVQLPLGLALDRFGPRRVEALLLVVAALGALIFSLGDDAATLILGRALIGLGVSACLMGAFKALVQWFPAERLPLVNGLIMAAGGLGALTATAPVEAALGLTDWRGVFQVLAGLTLLSALLLFLLVPEKPARTAAPKLSEQLRGLGHVFAHPLFHRVVPITVASQATFLSIQGLWSGPWLRDVAGLDRGPASGLLLAIAACMVAGFLTMGFLAERASRLGIRPIIVAFAGMAVFWIAQAGLILGLVDLAVPLWLLFGFFGTAGILPYAYLSQTFAPELAGRVNTAVNLLVFLSAFAAQAGIGAIIALFPEGASGHPPEAYGTAFGVLLALQGLAFAWAMGPWRDRLP